MRDDIEIAAAKRARYRRDPAHRLAKINATRRRNGLPEHPSLEAVKLRRLMDERLEA